MKPESASRTTTRVVIPRSPDLRRWRPLGALEHSRSDQPDASLHAGTVAGGSSGASYEVIVNGFVEAVRRSGLPPVALDHDLLFDQAEPMLESIRERARSRRAAGGATAVLAPVRGLHDEEPQDVEQTDDTDAVGRRREVVTEPSALGLVWGMGRDRVDTVRAQRAVEQLAADARTGAAELGATLSGSDPKLAELAGTRLRELMGQVLSHLQYAPDLEPRSRAQRAVHRLNRHMWAARKRTVALPRMYWGWAPLVSAILKPGTFLAVLWFLTRERPMVALLVFLVGRGLSLLLPSAYGIESLDESRFSWRISVYGHFGDAAGLLCLGAYLVRYDRTFWAALLCVSAILMLCGTIIRLAAVHSADFVVRLCIERIARDGSMVGALALEALMHRPGGPALVPGTSVPMIVLAGVGPAAYAGVEAWRVRRRALLNELRRAQLSPEARLADLYLELHPAIDEPRFHRRSAAM